MLLIPNPINNWSILLVKISNLCVESFENGTTVYCHFRLVLAPFSSVTLEHYISGIGIIVYSVKNCVFGSGFIYELKQLSP